MRIMTTKKYKLLAELLEAYKTRNKLLEDENRAYKRYYQDMKKSIIKAKQKNQYGHTINTLNRIITEIEDYTEEEGLIDE